MYSSQVLLSGLVSVGLLLTGKVSAGTKPNIMFIMIDDLGWNDVGFHGASDAYTPFLDQLATEESLILSNSYAQHYCTQSRTALLTGRYPLRLGLQHRVIEPESAYGLPRSIKYSATAKSAAIDLPVRTIADILKENGYNTHLVGKWHLGFCYSSLLPTARGFDTFYGFFNGEGDHYLHAYQKSDIFGYDLRNGTEPVRDVRDYSTYLYGNVTRDILRKYGSGGDDTPFYLYLAFQVVHSPNESPDTFKDPYRSRDSDRVNRVAMSTAVDSAISQLITTLKDETNLWDNTLVVIQSDNGGPVTSYANNWPLRGGKFSLFEGGIRVVTFVTGGLLAESRRRQTTDQLVYIADWYPTFLELVGITSESEYLSTLDGVSQLSVIQENGPAVRDSIVHNVDPLACNTDDNLCGGIRKGEWKLVVGREVTAPLNILAGWNPLKFDRGEPTVDCGAEQPKFVWNPLLPPFNGKPLLFNIASDPCEYFDVSSDYPDVVSTLLAELTEFNTTMMPPAQSVYPKDLEAANPANFDGFWGPWLDEDQCSDATCAA